MNQIQVVLLVSYLIVQLLEYALEYLNLKHLMVNGGIVPAEFDNMINEDELLKTRDYTIDNMKLDLISSMLFLVLQIAFIFGGFLDIYNTWIVSLSSSFLIQGLLFFLVLGFLKFFIDIPFDLYGTFHIEEKYGFNTKTVKLWIIDSLKSLLLSLVLFLIIGSAGLWIVNSNPETWWIWVWLFFTVVSLFLMYISPYVLEPLFNKFTPLDDDDELASAIRNLMQKAQLSISRVFKVDASKRSKHSNAYFTGIGKVKRIVLYDTLIELLSHNEILTVLAHEAGHWKKKHILKRIILSQLLGILFIYIGFQVIQSEWLVSVFQIVQSSFFVKIYLLAFLSSIISFFQTPFMAAWSRKHEREADNFALNATQNPSDMVTAFLKLSKDNLSNLHPHPLYAKFYYSHPPVIERIHQIRQQANQ